MSAIREYPAPHSPRLGPEVVVAPLCEEYGWTRNMIGLIARPRKGADWAELSPAEARKLAALLQWYADQAEGQS